LSDPDVRPISGPRVGGPPTRPARYGLYLADLDRAGTSSQGIITYSRGLLAHLAPLLASNEKLILLATPDFLDELTYLDSPSVEAIPIDPPRSLAQRLARDNLLPACLVSRYGLDLIHFPKGIVPLLGWPSCRVAVTIHDTIPLTVPIGGSKLAQRARSLYMRAALARALSRSHLVLVPSFAAQGEIERSFPGLDAHPLVAYQGSDPLDPPDATFPVPPQYALVFGSPFVHKHSAEAITFTSRYLDERGLFMPILVAGTVPMGLPATVLSRLWPVLGVYKGPQVTGLISGASFLVSASRLEGFGRPPIEALASGTRCVLARNPAAEELLGAYPGIYSPGDYSSFAAATDAVFALPDTEVERWTEHVHSQFSWDRLGATVLQQYRRILRDPEPQAARQERWR